jgi:hypothetical protein
MSIYANAKYRVGHQGYCGYYDQSAALVGPTATADPVVSSVTPAHIGPCAYPGSDRSDNMGDVESIASFARDLSKFAGRREYSVRNTVQVADGAYFGDTLGHVIRNRTDPDATGYRKGLRLHQIWFGVDSRFQPEVMTRVAVDTLVNSCGFTFAEGQPVSANVDWWPIAVLEPTGVDQTVSAAPSGDILTWAHLQATNNGTDYHPILARISVQIGNNLQRINMRRELTDGTDEYAISRTPYSIEPGLEKVQLSMELHDELPAVLRTRGWWTKIGGVGLQLYAAHSATLYQTTKRHLTINLGDLCLSRQGQQEIAAGRPFSWSADVAAIGLAIAAGVVA